MSRPRAEVILRYIGANVRRLRVATGWTQGELALRAGLKLRYVQILETGVANPTVRVLLAVAAALKIAPTELFQPAPTAERKVGRPRAV